LPRNDLARIRANDGKPCDEMQPSTPPRGLVRTWILAAAEPP